MALSNDFRVKNGLVVATTATIQSTATSTSTTTGALTVAGGLGVGGAVYVGGQVYSQGWAVTTSTSFANSANLATTATNLAGGTTGSIPYQTAAGLTQFIGIGAANTILTSNGSTATWQIATGTLAIGLVTTGTSINTYTSTITNVTGLYFDNNSGFDVRNLGSGNVFVGLNSTFKYWTVSGQPTLIANGLDTVNFVAGNGLQILTSSTSIPQSITFQLSTTATLTATTITVTSTASSTSTTTGALTVQGGVGIGGSLNVFGNSTFTNALTVIGNVISSGNIVTGNTQSTGTNTGALVVAGGVGVGGSLFVGNTATIISTVNSVSTTTGALVVAGGVGVGGNIYAGNVYSNGVQLTPAGVANTATNIAGGTAGSIVYQTSLGQTGFIGIGGTGTFLASSGSTATFTNTINNTAASVSSSTGALVVNGGVGIGGSLNVFGNSTFTNVVTIGSGATGLSIQPFGGSYAALYSTNVVPGVSNYTFLTDGASPNFNGTNGVYFNINNSNKVQVTNNNVNITPTVQATNSTTAALTVAGGVGIGNGLYVAGPSTFTGPVTFNGTTTYVFSTNTVYTDNLIDLHVPPSGTNWNVDDGRDIGLRFQYYANSTDTSAALVLANGSKQLEWFSSGVESTGTTSTFTGAYGGIKAGFLTLTSSTVASSTTTGALVVAGGVGIGGSLYAGTIYSNGIQINTTGIANTATNIQGGSAGFIPIQTAPGQTSFITTGTASYVLQMQINNTATWVSTSSLGISGGGTTLSVVGGTDTSVSTVSGIIYVWSTSTLQSVTNRGSNTNQIITFSNTTQSTSTNTGAVIVTGGLGVASSVYVGNTLTVTSSVASSSTATGALIVAGGAGIGGNLYAGNLYDSGNRVVTVVTPTAGAGIAITASNTLGPSASFTIANFGVTSLTGTTYLGVSANTGSVTLTNLGVQTLTAGTDTAVSANTGTVTVWTTSTLQSVTNRGSSTTNQISLTNVSASTSTTTGALLVSGGVGVGGQITAPQIATLSLTSYPVGSNANLLIDPDGSGDAIFSTATQVLINDTATSVSTTTGALVIAGGVGIGGTVYTSGLVYSQGWALSTSTGGGGGTVSLAAGTDTTISTVSNITYIWSTATLQSITTRPGANTTTATLFVNNGTNSVNNVSTGAIVVSGGVGVGASLSVGGNLFVTGNINAQGTINATISGSITTATNLGGGVAGDLVYQGAPGITRYINIGSTGSLLQSNGSTATWISSASIHVGTAQFAVTATNIAGGTVGAIHYQSNTGTSNFITIGTAGTVLQSNGTTATFQPISNLTAGFATTTTNILGGAAGWIPIQNGTGTTTFIQIGTTGTVLQSNGTTATWVSTTTIQSGYAGTATNLSGGVLGVIPYQTGPGVTQFIGTGTNGYVLTSNGSTATWQQVAASLTITSDTTSNSTYYPMFSTVASGIITTATISSSKLTWNPSTGILTAVDVNTTSDIRQKTNIDDITDPLMLLNQLKGWKFNYKESGLASFGVIAQELETILPQLVGENDSGLKTVRYLPLIAILIESVKTLAAEVQTLKNSNK